ncbi:MAG TPA: PAS domain-containing protein, partial [Pedobacter sp.]
MHVNPEEYLNQPIFQILFHQNTQAMWIVDDETLSFLEVNDSAVRMYGYSREEFLTMTLLDLNVGVPLECKSSGNETFILETSHFNKSKQVVEVEETLYPFVFNQKESRLSSVRDITAKKKRAVLAEYLMLATEVVGIAVNTSTALEQISDLIVPKFADWFTINVVNGEDIDLLVVKNDSQEYMDWSLDHRRRNPLTIHGQGATQHALRTGESFLVPVVTPEMLEQAIQDKEQLEMIKKLNLRSSIIVPMKVQNRTTGTINFISTVDGKQYDEIDLQFATDFALRIGLSLENARLNELALQEKRQVELSQQNLNRMIMQAPVAMCILSGQEYVIDVANETMFKLWGLGTEFSKRPIFEGLPHLKKAFKPLLDEVYYDDKALNFDEAPVELIREEALETRFLNFTYRPVKEADGSTSGVLAVAIDVTSQVVSRRKIEEAEEEAQAMNEELTSMNEELSSANEEQAAINEELLAARMESEIERERLKSFIMLAPAGICVLGGSDLVFELVNPAYQELLPGRNLEGRAILEALPELTGTPVEDILKNVYKTGERFTVNELLIPVAEHEGGKTRDRFFTFNYLARKNNQGTIDGILAFVYEVTENVNSRREVERAEESLRMAAESAELGIWQLQQSSQKLTVSPRFYQLFGLQESDGISFDKVMALVQD